MKRARTNGFTAVEVLLAMVVTSLVALTVTSVFMALSTAQQHCEDQYLYVQEARNTARYLQARLRKARLLTAADSSGMVLWAQDANANGLINVSELRVITYDAAARTLRESRVAFPDSLSADTRAALDVTKTVASLSVPANVKLALQQDYAAYYQEETLAGRIRGFSVQPDAAAPMTRLVKVRLTIGSDQRSMTLYASASLRADYTSHLGLSGGQYVLIVPG